MLDLFDYQDRPNKLRVKVTPNAKSERIKKETAPDGGIMYKVYVAAPAKEGKANEAVIRLLSKALGVAKSSVTITHGHTSREKIISVNWV